MSQSTAATRPGRRPFRAVSRFRPPRRSARTSQPWSGRTTAIRSPTSTVPAGRRRRAVVAEAMVDYLYHHNANTHWNYPSSAETDAMLARARQAMADFLNASPDEIYFGANATTLAFHTSRAIGQTLAPGDEIVVTELDHHANVGPWQTLARERGVTLQMVRMDLASGALDWNDFESKMTPRTKLVAIGAASNALGTINDVARAATLARR